MELVRLLEQSRRLVAFTGAGVSTESGIPDFRTPGGLWSRYDPGNFEFERYVADPQARKTAWEMRREFFRAPFRPNAAHHALARLEEVGRSLGVITQNIDGLHQRAGSQRVVELHGTALEVRCIGADPTGGTPLGCGWRAPYTWAFERIDAGEEDPRCPECGGLVKSATVSFGEMLRDEDVRAANRLVADADLLLIIGSSLNVYPAAGLPVDAATRGIPLVIVNAEPTQYDRLADLVVHGRAGEVLGPAVERLLG